MKKLWMLILTLALLLGCAACAETASDSEIDEILTSALQKINMPPTTEKDLVWEELTKGLEGVRVDFYSSDTAIINNIGQVFQTLEDQTVTIAARATYKGRTMEKQFTVRVLSRAQTPAEKIAQAKEQLLISTELRENITLPSTVGETGVLVTWQSDDPGVITSEGIITPNGYKGTDKTATLTATIQMGGVSDTKQFSVTVKALGLDSVKPTVILTGAELSDVNGKASLTLRGTAFLDAENTDRSLRLAFDKDAGLTLVENSVGSADSREFCFVLSLSSLNIAPGDWKDLNVLITENGTEKPGDVVLTDDNRDAILAGSVSVAEGKYAFKEWNGSLKVTREEILPLQISKNSNESVYVTLRDGKPILVVKGSIAYSQETDIPRTIRFELRENRLPGGKIVYQNLSQSADTRQYHFEADLSVLTENGLGNGDWVNMFLLLTEGARSYEGDLTRDDVVCDSNQPSLSTGYRRYYFEKWENYLKVVTSPDESIKESNIFLNTTDAIRLEQENGDIYLVLQGNAYISNTKLDVASRSIRLKLEGNLYIDNQYAGSGDNSHYYFKIKLNDYADFLSGMRVEVTEVLTPGGSALTKNCEVKQAAWNDSAGAFVPKPGGGQTAVLTACGVYSTDQQTYSLIVDEWNNIKIKASGSKILTLSPLVTTEDVSLVNEGGRIYLVLRGYAYIDENAPQRSIKLAVDLVPSRFEYNNVYEGSDPKAFVFRVDVTDLDVSVDWYKFKVQVTEGDSSMASEFPQNTFTAPLTNSVAVKLTLGTKVYMIKYEWSQVYLKIEKA